MSRMVNWFVWSSAVFVSFSGFLFGYDVGSMNGVKDMKGYHLTLDLSNGNISSDEEGSCNSQDDVKTNAILGLIVAVYPVGGLVGALLAGVLSDFAGRKRAIIIGASLAALGGLIHTSAVNLGMVLLSRIINGIAIGILYQVTPLYVAEISPEELRGKLLSFLNIYATTGYLIGTIVNIITKNYIFGWRISLSLQFIAGTVLALGTLLLPRSPRWLVKRGKEAVASKILSKIYMKDDDKIQNKMLELQSVVNSTKEPFIQTLKFVSQWKFIQRILLGFFMLLLGRFSGGNFITYFSVSILCGIGLPGFVVTIAISIANSSFMFLTLGIVDKLGRKPLFLIGSAIMAISHIISASLIRGFHLEEETLESVSQKVAGYVVLVSMSLFVGGFTISCGNIPWIIVGEIFPLRAKGFMISICNTAFWIGLMSVNQIGPILVNSSLHIFGTLLFFSGACTALFVYVLLFLPETKGVSLEKMEQLFSKPWLKRTNVLYYLCCGCFSELFGKNRLEQSEETHPLEFPMDQLSLSSSILSLDLIDEDNVDSHHIH